MFVPVYPSSPTPALTSALIAAGYQPVPIDDLSDLEARQPEEGWKAAVVEAASDVGNALSVAHKITEEHSLAVLLVVDRTATELIGGEPGYTDFILSPLDHAELKARMSRLGGVTETVDDDTLRYHDLELNTATYQAAVAGEPRDLTYMEYELLRFFLETRPGCGVGSRSCRGCGGTTTSAAPGRSMFTCGGCEPSSAKSAAVGSPRFAPSDTGSDDALLSRSRSPAQAVGRRTS